jgi:hypothetical protein
MGNVTGWVGGQRNPIGGMAGWDVACVSSEASDTVVGQRE